MTFLIRSIAVASFLILGACSKGTGPTTAAPEPLLVEGKYAVVNYWAEWCKPCREEIPELNQLAKIYQDQTVVYAINFDGVSGTALDELSQAFGIEYPSRTIAQGKSLGITRPAALPTTVIFDPTGNMIATLVGPQTAQSLASYFSAK